MDYGYDNDNTPHSEGNNPRSRREGGKDVDNRIESFLPMEGIEWQVIVAELPVFLGGDCEVEIGEHRKTKRAGYYIMSSFTLTIPMITDLKAFSAQWLKEERDAGRSIRYTQSNTFRNRYRKQNAPPPQPTSQQTHPRSGRPVEEVMTRKEAERLIAQRLKDSGQRPVTKKEFEDLIDRHLGNLRKQAAERAEQSSSDRSMYASQQLPSTAPPSYQQAQDTFQQPREQYWSSSDSYQDSKRATDPNQPDGDRTIGFNLPSSEEWSKYTH